MCKAAALDYRSDYSRVTIALDYSRASLAVATTASQDFRAKPVGTKLIQDQARKSSSNRSLRFQTSMIMQPGTWLRTGHSQGSSIKQLPVERQVHAEPVCSSSFTMVLGSERPKSSGRICVRVPAPLALGTLNPVVSLSCSSRERSKVLAVH